ncbi:hypothetical protein SHLA_92c000220 [Shinella sp. DD12]|nr:hypothetical protein SHLA_92c000220 [Shinella sp. DD12]
MHFYPFTGQAQPIPMNILTKLGIPAGTVAELVRRGLLSAAKQAAPDGGDHA